MVIPVSLQPNNLNHFIKTCVLKYQPNIHDEILYTDQFLSIITLYSPMYNTFLWNAPNPRNINVINIMFL